MLEISSSEIIIKRLENSRTDTRVFKVLGHTFLGSNRIIFIFAFILNRDHFLKATIFSYGGNLFLYEN